MGSVSAQPAYHDDGPDQYDMIHLGGETALVVPVSDYRRLRALERRATPEALDDAEAEAAFEEYREWSGAGRQGAVPHDQARAMLLGDLAGGSP